MDVPPRHLTPEEAEQITLRWMEIEQSAYRDWVRSLILAVLGVGSLLYVTFRTPCP